MVRSTKSILAAIAATLVSVRAVPAAIGAPVRIPGDAHEEVAKLGDLNGLTALAIADDGTTAAGAFVAEKPGRSLLRLSRGAGTGSSPAEIAIRGRIRSLRFSRDGAEVYVIAARDGKRESGEAFLLRVPVATREISREFVLPRGATDVDWIDASTLIVAAPDELRTFSVPSLTSGPLYRLAGTNRAIAAVPGTRRLLVAGDDAIVLVDLDDPQSRDGLPARETLPLSPPVVALAIAPDGSEALARHEDGHVDRFTVEPLGGAVADGRAVAIAWPGPRKDGPPPAPRPQVAAQAPAGTAPAAEASVKEPQAGAVVVAPPKSTATSPPAPSEARAMPPAPDETRPPATEPKSAFASAGEPPVPPSAASPSAPSAVPQLPPSAASPSAASSVPRTPPSAPSQSAPSAVPQLPPSATSPSAASSVPRTPPSAPSQSAPSAVPQTQPGAASPSAPSAVPQPPPSGASPSAESSMPPTRPSAASPTAAPPLPQASPDSTPPLASPVVPSGPTPPANQNSQPALPPPVPQPQTAVAPQVPPAPRVVQEETTPTPPPETAPMQPEPAPPPQTQPPAPQPGTSPTPPPAAPPPPEIAPGTETIAADRVVVRGSITGAVAAQIAAVVILGPDNLLHEAARVKPSADGTWSVTDLAPGAYRIQLDAGSGRVVEANPAFRTVRIERSGTVQLPPIEARRLL